jgi:hypothetical protein
MIGSSGPYVIVEVALIAGLGAWMLFFQGHYGAWRRRQHARALADRLARGSDAYFEELRELRAYPPGRLPDWRRRLGGALMLLFGTAWLAVMVAQGGRP